jgi:phosphate transport system substrate-binding protein
MEIRCVLLTGLIAVILIAAGLPASFAQDADAKAVVAKAAMPGTNLLERWGKDFNAKKERFAVMVVGTTGEEARRALMAGEVPVALSVERITHEQKAEARKRGIQLGGRLIAFTGIAIVTHPENPVDVLTMDDVKSLFMGEYIRWKQVGGPDTTVRVVTKPPRESTLARFFQHEVLDWKAFASNAELVTSFPAIIRHCSESSGEFSIGFIPHALLRIGKYRKRIKVLALKRCAVCPEVEPTEESINSLTYPIGRVPLYLYWNAAAE